MIDYLLHINPVVEIGLFKQPVKEVQLLRSTQEVVLKRNALIEIQLPVIAIAGGFVFVDENGNPFISEDNQNKFKPEE